MKNAFTRILSLLLVCSLVLAGCGSDVPSDTTENTTEPAETLNPYVLNTEGPFISSLSVGFGRVEISPTESTPLGGYGNSAERLSQNIEDPLYATCITLTDSADNTVLLFSLDLISCFTEVMNAARQSVSDETDIPVEAIMVAATSTHSGPDLGNTEDPAIALYIESLKGWMVEAALSALEDRALTRVYITSTKTENLNFVRRYQLQDGSYAGDHFGSFQSAPIAVHETEADNQLQLVCFYRENKPDVILANFQTHLYRNSSATDTDVTADIIAPFRETMERTLGCHFAYFTGASGNVNPTSRIESENVTANHIEQGQALADYALAAYSSFREVPTTSVKIAKTVYNAKVDHTFSGWGSYAKEAMNYYAQNGELGGYGHIFQSSGIRNMDHLSTVITRSQMPAQQSINLYAISLGDLAFVTVPFEMFDTNGMQIKAGSPYSMTFVLSSANQNYSYLPSEAGFKHGGYEVDTTLFVRGTAEELVTNYLGMLNSLYYGK